MPEGADATATTEDALLGGRVLLRQPARGHRAGTDAVLLAAMCGARPGDRVADLGSASGAVGLMIAAQVERIELVLVEREAHLIALARENLALNGATGSAVALDLFDDPARWPDLDSARGGCDLAVTNPPYFDVQQRPSPNPERKRAHLMEGGDLTGWLRAARRFLRPGGRVVTIGRSDRLAAAVDAVRASFGSLTVTPIYPRAGADATLVVIGGRVGGRAPEVIAAPIVLHEATGSFTGIAEAWHTPGGPAPDHE